MDKKVIREKDVYQEFINSLRKSFEDIEAGRVCVA